MNKKKSSWSSPLVYSTDPSFIRQENKENTTTTLPAEHQQLKVSADKRHRAGKIVTLVTGFSGKEEDIEQLGKELKSFCGTGGSVKDGIIMIQGDNREKIVDKLLKNGFKHVKKI